MPIHGLSNKGATPGPSAKVRAGAAAKAAIGAIPVVGGVLASQFGLAGASPAPSTTRRRRRSTKTLTHAQKADLEFLKPFGKQAVANYLIRIGR